MPVAPNAQEALEDLLSNMERDRDVWLGWTWWAAGSRWGNYMFTIEPKEGADRPQMGWLQPHLNGAAMPKFEVVVENGTGGGSAPGCSARPIKAGPGPAGKVFKEWRGDVAWLQDASTRPK